MAFASVSGDRYFENARNWGSARDDVSRGERRTQVMHCDWDTFVLEGQCMRRRRRVIDDPEWMADTDASLRSMSRLFPQLLARLVVQSGEGVRRMQWGETQLAARQQRVDRLLHVEMEDGTSRVLHLEWTVRLNREVMERMSEYHITLTKQLRQDVRMSRRRGETTIVDVTVQSVAVVLTGRKRAWPQQVQLRTTPRGERFSGVRFRVEAVYQRTVAELWDKGGVLWLAFVPVAVDVDEEKIRRTVDKVRSETNEEEFAEIISTMMSVASLKSARRGLVEVIWSAAQEGTDMRHPLFRFGHEAGLKEGRVEGREAGRGEGLAPLLYLFERRLGRSLTDGERRRIASRLTKQGPEKLGSVVLDLSPEQLEAWLAPRKLRAA